ncbi:RcpC/CpaB family pilus assembly protein [Desulfonema magnum]|uniref:Pilus assembly protein domain-containing protein n=1 Tax=Desulfonema magnum TaxID=45655 RepID=A0A975GMJ0_9BACT|nr:RcpC/CpaB family pilus assembly protein [Desulfonema magnum]QTA86744.1 Pilus assembly protein domain-containing protein [Desulfonema magnum]
MGSGRVSRVILQNIELLDMSLIGKGGKGGGKTKAKKWTVSLLISPQEAPMLSVYAQTSELMLSARNPDDNEQIQVEPIVFSADTGEAGLRKLPGDITRKIPLNMRAVSLPVGAGAGICKLFRPGDRVDVLVKCNKALLAMESLDMGAEGKSQGPMVRETTKIILQDVEILATENTVMPGPDVDRPVKMVTLLLTPEDAEKVVLLNVANGRMAIASVTLIARNRDDRSRFKTEGQLLSEILSGRKEYHKVRIFRGRKSYLRKFAK